MSLLGPIVRITPDEVHLSDPDNYERIYHVGSRYSKDANFYGAFGNENSSFTTPANELHRKRRTGLNSFFSRRVVIDLEDIVQDKARLLCRAIDNAITTTKPMDLHHALRAVSIDVITEYAFGQSYGLLETADFGYDFFMLVQRLGPAAWIFRQVPWLKVVLRAMPKSIVRVVSAPMSNVINMQLVSDGSLLSATHFTGKISYLLCHKHCNDRLRNIEKEINAGTVNPNTRATIFSALMTPDAQRDPAAVAHLEDEAYTVLTAAADTTGNAMTTICRYVFADRVIYDKLHNELKAAFPRTNEIMSYQALEKLPYLVSIPKELIE
jgi:cytochrome P450